MDATRTTVTDRLEIVELKTGQAGISFGDDVAAGLSLASKRLASKYFYDDLGSVLFDAITLLPEYYLTRAETQILQCSGWEIVRMLDAPFEFLELGSGSAVKTRLLIEEALRVQSRLRYSPIDISKSALASSSASLVDTYPHLTVRAYAGDYFTVLESRELQFENRVLAMFMGSNIGNYEPAQARQLLTSLARALRPGDGLLLGTDLKKDRATLEAAYNDSTGVTAAFNRNLLGRINRELGGTFDLHDFDFVATYDEGRGVVDSYLVARRPLSVSIEALRMQVKFERGERIHTEASYKYDRAIIASMALACGYSFVKTWRDPEEQFAIQLLVRV